jgi:hypothetical protein
VKYHIDIDDSAHERRTVCELSSNLVTRPTGATVRKAIEDALADQPEPNMTVIDFSRVTLLDFSCADEIVGKLLDSYQGATVRRQTYFLIRGAHRAHLEAIETVLERYDVAVIVQDDQGGMSLIGQLDDGARRVWQLVQQRGAVVLQQVEQELGTTVDQCIRAIDELSLRRLVVRRDDGFVALPHAS